MPPITFQSGTTSNIPPYFFLYKVGILCSPYNKMNIQPTSSWWFQLISEFSPRSLKKWSNLTAVIFFKWIGEPNHQLWKLLPIASFWPGIFQSNLVTSHFLLCQRWIRFFNISYDTWNKAKAKTLPWPCRSLHWRGSSLTVGCLG